MQRNKKVISGAVAAAAVVAGGVGIAYGVGGDDSEAPVTGPDADKAQAAALDAVGGGTVSEIEYQEAGSAGVYEVEVVRDDGSQVEVHIDGSFDSLGTAADDDGAGDDEGAGDDDGPNDD